MRVLFATNFFYLPQRTGGSESSTHDLCNELLFRGHDVAVVSCIKKYDFLWYISRIISKINKTKFSVDYIMKYPVYRGYGVKENIGEVLDRFKPDVVVVQAGQPFEIVNAVSSLEVPVVLYVRDVEFETNKEKLKINSFVKVVSNSSFTSKRFEEKFGVGSLVLPPLIDFEKYHISNKGNAVIHIGLSPLKGVDISFKIAESRPDIPFVFVESWPLPAAVFEEYQAQAKKLGNVNVLKRQKNMKKVYSQGKILLAPSGCEEAWGRVVTESQYNGIPVIASNRGGLPEAVGDGGIIVPHDADPNEWVNALSRLWDNPDVYADYSAKALARCRRDDVDKEKIIEKFIAYLQAHVSDSKKEFHD
jgi:glycosyltransferase involved in cell wall biosynthesis